EDRRLKLIERGGKRIVRGRQSGCREKSVRQRFLPLPLGHNEQNRQGLQPSDTRVSGALRVYISQSLCNWGGRGDWGAPADRTGHGACGGNAHGGARGD